MRIVTVVGVRQAGKTSTVTALIADTLETIMKEGIPTETAARRCKP